MNLPSLSVRSVEMNLIHLNLLEFIVIAKLYLLEPIQSYLSFRKCKFLNLKLGEQIAPYLRIDPVSSFPPLPLKEQKGNVKENGQNRRRDCFVCLLHPIRLREPGLVFLTFYAQYVIFLPCSWGGSSRPDFTCKSTEG